MPRFYFAWVDPLEQVFNPSTHAREDEKIISFTIEQLETEFASLTIDIKNPRIGLLNAGRKLWAWFAWDNDTVITPLFFGRVVGIPSNINREVVTLQFVARPSDFAAQKEQLAEYMRVLPYYDPVFISEEKQMDPDVVLEGRTEVWHIDRTTHEVTTSDIVVGEDGTLEYAESEVPYESVEISFDQPPIRRVRVTADVTWNQDVSSALAGGGLKYITNMEVDTLAGKGLQNGWPKVGTSLEGGWIVTAASATSPYDNVNDAEYASWVGRKIHQVPNTPDLPFYLSVVTAYSGSVSGNNIQTSSTTFAIINDKVFLNLSLGYEASRQFKDIINFELIADVQPIVTEPDDEEVLELSVSGLDVGLPVGPLGDVPIGSVLRRSYFAQNRGFESVQYLIQLARANIIIRARAVRVSFECAFDRALDLSLRKNALLHDRRLPGGQAVGKIVGYTMSLNNGRLSGKITIACAIGRGGAIAPSIGDGVYAAPGYMNPGYQQHDNEVLVLGPSDVGFTAVREAANDDGLRFPLRSIPEVIAPHAVTVETKTLAPVQPTVQPSTSKDDCGNTTSISNSMSLDTGPYSDWLGGIETNVEFTLKSLEAGPFETTYDVVVTGLKIPKQIDLEAPSV